MALSVADQIPAHYKRMFEDTFEHVIQQDKKRLADKVTVKNFKGKEKVYTDLEELSFVSRGRLQNSNPVEVSAHKRKLTKKNFKCQVIFDRSTMNSLLNWECLIRRLSKLCAWHGTANLTQLQQSPPLPLFTAEPQSLTLMKSTFLQASL
jgi:hypothetical protein